jgi:hypothetical protein
LPEIIDEEVEEEIDGQIQTSKPLAGKNLLSIFLFAFSNK